MTGTESLLCPLSPDLSRGFFVPQTIGVDRRGLRKISFRRRIVHRAGQGGPRERRHARGERFNTLFWGIQRINAPMHEERHAGHTGRQRALIRACHINHKKGPRGAPSSFCESPTENLKGFSCMPKVDRKPRSGTCRGPIPSI